MLLDTAIQNFAGSFRGSQRDTCQEMNLNCLHLKEIQINYSRVLWHNFVRYLHVTTTIWRVTFLTWKGITRLIASPTFLMSVWRRLRGSQILGRSAIRECKWFMNIIAYLTLFHLISFPTPDCNAMQKMDLHLKIKLVCMKLNFSLFSSRLICSKRPHLSCL